MSNTSTIFTEEHNIQTPCELFIVGDPQVLLIQPSARHEEKNGGVRREVDLIAQAGQASPWSSSTALSGRVRSCRGLTMPCRATRR